MTNNIEKQSFGQSRAVFLDTAGTATIAAELCAVQVITAATFSSLTWAELDVSAGDVLTGISIPAGTIIYGQIAGFTLSAGQVLAYKST